MSINLRAFWRYKTGKHLDFVWSNDNEDRSNTLVPERSMKVENLDRIDFLDQSEVDDRTAFLA